MIIKVALLRACLAISICTLGHHAAGQTEAEGTALAEYRTVVVIANRVNIRAKGDKRAEVVVQASLNDELEAKSITEEWVEIVPPTSADVWVHNEFVSENRVQPAKLNVRAGAGINYNVVGVLKRGDWVESRGSFGEWLKIAPPESCSFFISRQYVELAAAERPASADPDLVARPEDLISQVEGTNLAVEVALPIKDLTQPDPVTPVKAAVKEKASIPPPPDLDLVPLKGQGLLVEYSGILVKSPLVLGRPSRYRLLKISPDNTDTLCYIRGNDQQLTSLRGRKLKIKGGEYWVHGVRVPVLVPEKIVAEKKD